MSTTTYPHAPNLLSLAESASEHPEIALALRLAARLPASDGLAVELRAAGSAIDYYPRGAEARLLYHAAGAVEAAL